MLYNKSMDLFAALAAPRRRQVIEILSRRGKLSASQICDEFDVTPQAISQHLRVLREAHVVNVEKKAQQRLYTLDPRSVDPIQTWAAKVSEAWNRRLERLDRIMKEEST